MKRLAIFFITCWALTAIGSESFQASDKMVNVGTHRPQIHEEGTGTPTVVIDAGIADQLDKLRSLQTRIALLTHAIIYNRAGYGQSEPGPLPRDSEREADEIKALLVNASILGPYILVGHSLGALNMQVFASKYPEAVAGMILLDPPAVKLPRSSRTTGSIKVAPWRACLRVANSYSQKSPPIFSTWMCRNW